MAYATSTDVNALVPQAPFSASSRPTLTQVDTILATVSLRIDATIANIGYVVPVVSGATSLTLLKEAATWAALGIAQQARETAASVATSDRGVPGKNIWTRMFDEWLEKLTDPQDPFELPDAPRNNERLAKQPENVLRSFVQTLPGEDSSYDPDNPVISRYQTL